MTNLDWIRLSILTAVIFLMYNLTGRPVDSTFWAGLGLASLGLIAQYKLYRSRQHRRFD